MTATFYNGAQSTPDTVTKDDLTGDLLTKVVKQEIDSKVFDDVFGIFTDRGLQVGAQIEEFEIANLQATDFDPTGANTLKKANMDFKALYHKINRKKTYKATISDKQLREAMLSKENLATTASAIINELYNSSSIDDFEAVKTLLNDIAGEKKEMPICDMKGKGSDMDELTKAIQAVATNMTLPSTQYNYAGFKKEFNPKSDLVLIIDSATNARLGVETLANSFNPDKKATVSNVIVIDEMPNFEYSDLKATKGKSIATSADSSVDMYKYNSEGTETVSGKPICFLLNRKAIKRINVERNLKTQENGAGDFTNYYLHATDLLSYSTLRNAVVFVDGETVEPTEPTEPNE